MVRGQRCQLFPRSPAEKPTSSENCIKKNYPMFTNPSTSLLRVPGRVSPTEPQTSSGCPPSHHSPLPRGEELHSWSGVCVKDVLALSLTLLPCSFNLHLPIGSMCHESPGRGPDVVCSASKMVWFGWGNKSISWRHIHSPNDFHKKSGILISFCLVLCVSLTVFSS